MRVSFLGKGGSGKTTLSSNFIKYLNSKSKSILAVDADINVNLGKTLNMESKFLGDSLEEISMYFEENRNKKENKKGLFANLQNNFLSNTNGTVIIGTTPPSRTTKFIKPNFRDNFFDKYSTSKDNIRLLTIGTYNDSAVGYSCYHGKLGVAELIYNRLLDDKNLFVVSDSTAGVDSVGTSMFCVSDINIFVVEPTIKSIDVYNDFERITEKYGLNNYVIANKIKDEQDIEFINSKINNKKILGFVKESNQIRLFDKGNEMEFDSFVELNKELNDKIYDLMLNSNRDWDKYYENVIQIYKDNCNDWYNQYYGTNLIDMIDPEFSYMEVIKK